MDTLPIEIVEKVCDFSTSNSLANLRLTSKKFNDVAFPRMVKDIHLVTMRPCFERLRTISKQSLQVRELVKSITWEMDMMLEEEHQGAEDKLISFEQWENKVYDDDLRDPEPEKPPADCSIHERRSYEKAYTKFLGQPRHKFTSQQLKRGWKEYQKLIKQQRADVSYNWERTLQRAASLFPNLRSCEAFWGTLKTPSRAMA